MNYPKHCEQDRAREGCFLAGLPPPSGTGSLEGAKGSSCARLLGMAVVSQSCVKFVTRSSNYYLVSSAGSV